ncbi:MAG: chemotaxis protein CheX [Candidatus Hydrogenedentota bacterium]
MQVEYINPFIESVYELFGTMLDAKVQRGTVGVSKGGSNPRDIMALIGLSGAARGMVALAFPVDTALKVVNRLLDSDVTIVDDTVSDAIAEVVNIVAGSAKARLNNGEGPLIDLSLPTIVRGNSFSVEYPSKSMWLDVLFDSDLGEFTMRVTFEMEATKGNHS